MVAQTTNLKPLKAIERRLEGARSPAERDEILYFALPLWFAKKQADPSYELPELAAWIFERALEITAGEGVENRVLAHPLEYVFLTSRRHYLDRHILTLSRLGNEARVIFSQGVLRFHTGEGVAEMRHLSDANPDLLFDLDFFQLRRRQEGEPTTKLCPNFQLPADGCYYVSVMTDCPENATTFLNHHCWLRLTDDEGRAISVGKFPMKIEAPFYLAKNAAYYSNADRYEWLNRSSVKEHRIRVSRAEYLRLKEDIEKDIRAAASCPLGAVESDRCRDFNFFVHNCADWALEKISSIVPVEREEVRRSQFTVLLPNVYHRLVAATPEPIRLTFARLRGFLGLAVNGLSLLLALLLGGWRRNSANPGSPSLLESWCKIFLHTDITKVTLPFYARQWLDGHLAEIVKEREPLLSRRKRLFF